MKIFAAAFAAIFLSQFALGADSPEFCGSRSRNMVSDETNLPATFMLGEKDTAKGVVIPGSGTNLLWGVRLNSIMYSTPSVVGDRLYIGGGETGKGTFQCLDTRTGKALWRYEMPHRKFPAELEPGKKFMLGRITPHLGICSTATVDGDRLYFVNHRCAVLCLSAKDGKVLWSFDLWEHGVRPSDACNGTPLIDGDLLYVCTSNGVDRDAQVAYDDDRKTPAPDAPNLIVLDKRNGHLVATDDVRQIGPNLLHGQWSTPSLGVVNGRKLIFFGAGDGWCYAFEALDAVPGKPVKLKTVWSFDCNPPEYRQADAPNWASRYSLGDKRLKQSLNKKNESTYVGTSEIIACPVFHKNRIYVAIGRDPEHGRGRGALWCIDATKTGDITKTGKIWSYQGLDRTLSTVAIADGLLYIADVAGKLHCLDAETGTLQWKHDTEAVLWSSTLVADGKIYLPTTKQFWILAAGKEKKVLDTIRVGAPVYASPVIANGVLYISAFNGWLYALRNAAPGK